VPGRDYDREAMAARRILYVHHRRELGGAPTSLAYLVRNLDRTRFEPHVYCPPGDSASLFRTAGAEVHEGPVSSFTHIWASTYRGLRWLLLARELGYLPGHVHAFRNVLSRTTPAIVHLNDSPLLAAAVMSSRLRIPVVWHLRAALPELEGPRRSLLLRRAVRRLSTASIAINTDIAESFGGGTTVIPNSVDLDRFRPADPNSARKRLGLPVDRPAIAYVGFVYPSKGITDFVEAAALLRDRGVDATYVIAGGAVRGAEFFDTAAGRAVERLGLAHDNARDTKALVVARELAQDVHFVPFTPEIELVYEAADVIVAPSRGPEIGRSVVEAFAAGRAVIASGSRDGAGIIVPLETGCLVPRGSPAAIADSLERLLRDDDLRASIGAKARAYAAQEFEPASNARRVMAVYDSLLEAFPKTAPGQ
jgi:glycosyltransferase involved in cell wall biosynthesis